MRAAGVCFVLVVIACGGRNLEYLGDLGTGEPQTQSGGGGAGSGGRGGSGGVSAGGEGGAGNAGAIGGMGAGPPNPVECLTCIGQSCPEVITCLMDPTCQQGLVCTVTSCLGGGQPDLMCVNDCFMGDLGAAAIAITALACVGNSCGDRCLGLLPGGP
jgi:hypothetical protein